MKIYLIKRKGIEAYYNGSSWEDLSQGNLLMLNDSLATQTRSKQSIWGHIQHIQYLLSNKLFQEFLNKTNNPFSPFQNEIIKKIEQRMGLSIPSIIGSNIATYNGNQSGFWIAKNVDSLRNIIICCLSDLLEVVKLTISYVQHTPWHVFAVDRDIDQFITQKMQKMYNKYKAIQGIVSLKDLE